MSLLVINALPPSDVDAQKAIKVMNPDLILQVDDLRLLPCIGCNACWLKTPGICGL